MPSDLGFSLLVWSRLSQISGGGLASPSTSLGATLVVMLRRQTDLHFVSLVGDTRVAHGEGGLASLLPSWMPSSRPGSVSCVSCRSLSGVFPCLRSECFRQIPCVDRVLREIDTLPLAPLQISYDFLEPAIRAGRGWRSRPGV